MLILSSGYIVPVIQESFHVYHLRRDVEPVKVGVPVTPELLIQIVYRIC